jgi:ABC-type glutathione transport system ATPase component
MSAPVLDIQDLTVTYQTGQGRLPALRDVSLVVPEGRIVGVVGESGCGKSTLISAIIRLLAPNARVDNGTIRFKGRDLLGLPADEMRSLRGDQVSIVFQDPMTSLNPVRTIGRQMADVQHRSATGRSAKYRNDRAGPGRLSHLARVCRIFRIYALPTFACASACTFNG